MATITGTSANETLSGTAADDTIIGLGGNDTLTGGGGRNIFSYTARQFGQDIITDFTLGLDRIDLTALGIAEFSLLQTFLTQSGLDTVLTFSYNGQAESITFRNILPAQLGAADFVFNTSIAALSQTGTGSSDVLFGGLGNDTLDGGFGNDQLLGGSGADILIGGASNDQLTGGLGNDTFTYNARAFGADTLLDFTQGQDRIDLSGIGIAEFSALQPFITQSGLDTVITLTYNGAPETITLRGIQPGQLSASDFIFNTSLTALTLTGTGSVDVLFGGNGNDSLSGGFGNDTLHGGQGTDLINGGASNDQLTGGGGNDLFVYNDRAFGVDTITDFTLGQDRLDFSVLGIGDLTTLLPYITQVGANTVISFTYLGSPETITLQNVQANQLTAANFVLNGSTNALTVSGTSSADVLFGGLGNDTLNGGFGNDTLTAGQGNDNLIGGASDDTLIGAAGNDLFTYDARQFGDDTVLDFTQGQDRLNFSLIGIGSLDVLQPFIAQVGADTVITMGYGSSTESIVLRNIQASQLGAADFVFATVTSPVTITGTGFSDTLFGGSAADTLDGSFGNDRLSGGQGDDTLLGGSGSDTLIGGAGNDRMEGGIGNDTYYVDSAGDQTIEAAGEGVDTVVSNGSFSLAANIENGLGGSGSDTIIGNSAGNGIDGGLGLDVLTGGGGRDTFRSTIASLSGDRITDFSVQDVIQVVDANIATFSYTRSGNTLSFGGISLTVDTLAGLRIGVRASSDVGVEFYSQGARTLLDTSGDGRADLYWANTSGAISEWISQGSTFTGGTSGFIGADWTLAGRADFNGDGRADLVWRNTNGTMSEWLSTGSGFVNGLAGFVGTDWALAGTDDFNGDGLGDILWRNTNGSFTTWQSDGTGFTGGPVGGAGNDWQIAGTGDFNGDGKADLLWRHTSGTFSEWLSSGSTFAVGTSGFRDNTWSVAGIGDFDGDGKNDLLWRSTSGAFEEWYTRGAGFVNGYTGTLSTAWQVGDVADYNGDGRADIMWRANDGSISQWLTGDNGFLQGMQGFVPTDWHLV